MSQSFPKVGDVPEGGGSAAGTRADTSTDDDGHSLADVGEPRFQWFGLTRTLATLGARGPTELGRPGYGRAS